MSSYHGADENSLLALDVTTGLMVVNTSTIENVGLVFFR